MKGVTLTHHLFSSAMCVHKCLGAGGVCPSLQEPGLAVSCRGVSLASEYVVYTYCHAQREPQSTGNQQA